MAAITASVSYTHLDVYKRQVWWWTLGMTSTFVLIRGLEQMMYDMIDKPKDLHRLMAFLRDGNMAKIDWLEDNNLLYLNNDGTYAVSYTHLDVYKRQVEWLQAMYIE